MAKPRALAAEACDTAALLAVVVGSGVMAERLSPSNAGVALLANAIATGLALYVLITLFAPRSRAHFNPAVTLASWFAGQTDAPTAMLYVLNQCAAGVVGVVLAHAMFDLTLLQAGTRVRSGWGQWTSEAFATAGLVTVVAGASRHARAHVAPMVGAYIAAAYGFTASTSSANPAVTLARAMTDTFSGIRPADAPAFALAQLAGLRLALVAIRLLFASAPTPALPRSGPV